MNEDRDEVTTEGKGYVGRGKSKANTGNSGNVTPRKHLQAEILARLGLVEQPVRNPLEVLQNPRADWITQVQAIRSLAQSEQAAAGVWEIIRILDDLSRHPALRAAAARSLADLWERKLIPLAPFVKALADPDLDVQVAAIEALKAVEAYNISDVLVKQVSALLKEAKRQEYASNNQYRRLRIAILQWFGLLKRESAFSSLEDALNDRDWEIRDAAVQAISAIIESLPPNDARRKRLEAFLEAMIDREEEHIVLQSLMLALRDHTPFRTRLLRGSNRVKENMAHILGDEGEQADAHELATDISVLIAVAYDSSADSAVRSATILRLARLLGQAQPRQQADIKKLLDVLSRNPGRGIKDAVEILQGVVNLPAHSSADSLVRERKKDSQIGMNDFRANRNDT